MDKEKYISATDINKYTYCNYAYYYEKVYGANKLRQLKKEYNKLNGFESNNEAFKRGQIYHDNYLKRSKGLKLVKIMGLFVLIIILVFVTRGILW
ncbi:MAG: hypothetical protein ACK5LV_00070 [Lachnospirales bacterium]